MRPTFLGFESSKKSIMTSQKALDIVGNNMANMETKGYTRQRVDLVSIASRTGGLRYGTVTNKISLKGQGVTSPGVAQVRDPFLDKRYRENNALLAESETTASMLSDIEELLGKTQVTGLKELMGDFQQALDDYTGQPDSEEYASLLRSAAQNITLLLKTNSTRMAQIVDQAVVELQSNIENVNIIADKILLYNKQIANEYVVSTNTYYGPNELLDQRNMLLDDLSALGNINVKDNPDGTVTVNFGGVDIVDGSKTIPLEMKDYYKYDEAILQFANGDDAKGITTGSIKSYLDILNGGSSYAIGNQSTFRGIPYYQSAMDEFAAKFAELMNTVNGADDTAGRLMFVSSSGGKITASNISISEEWLEDACMVGMVRTYNEDEGKYEYLPPSNDSSNILKLKNSLSTQLKFGDAVTDFTGTIEDYLETVTNRLAQDIDYRDGQIEAVSSTVLDIMDSRDAISAVSADEEGINMLNFQKWFNASSRLLTTLDDALNTIINSMGRVGL